MKTHALLLIILFPVIISANPYSTNFILGLHFDSNADYASAVQFYSRIERKDAEYLASRINLVRSLYLLSQYRDCITTSSNILKEFQIDSRLSNRVVVFMAHSFLKINDTRSAKDILKIVYSSIKHQETDEAVIYLYSSALGILLYKDHQYSKAIEWVISALERMPQEPELCYILAQCAYKQNNRALAHEYFKKSIIYNSIFSLRYWRSVLYFFLSS